MYTCSDYRGSRPSAALFSVTLTLAVPLLYSCTLKSSGALTYSLSVTKLPTVTLLAASAVRMLAGSKLYTGCVACVLL
jgi:hypothetical protein